MTARVRKGALVATVANPATAKASTAKRKGAKPKAHKPKPKVSNMAQKKKKTKSGARSSKKSSKKRPRQSNPANPRSHGMLTLPRGTMLVPVGHAKRGTKRKGGHPRKRNPGSPPHHEMLRNGAAAVAFGTLAATAGMLGGLALTKANIKHKWANVGANVAAGAIVGGGVGMLDRAAGTVTAHNYMVAAGQWLMQPAQASQGQGQQQQQTRTLNGAGAGASPQMLRASAPAMHGADDEMGDPPWEAIAPPRPNPAQRRAARQLHGYRGVSGLGSPLDQLGDGDDLGAYAHVDGLGSPLDQLGSVMADDVGSVMADDVGSPLDQLGDDFEGFEHLNGIMADDVGDGDELGDDFDAVVADDLGDDELAAAAAMDDDG